MMKSGRKLVDSPLFEPLLMLAAMAILSAIYFLNGRYLGGVLFLCFGVMGFAVDWLSSRGYRSWAWIPRVIGLAVGAGLLVIVASDWYSYF